MTRGCALPAMERTAARRERRPNSNFGLASAAARWSRERREPGLRAAGWDHKARLRMCIAPSACIEHRRGRRKAAGFAKSDGGRSAPALPRSLKPRAAMPRDREAVPHPHPGPPPQSRGREGKRREHATSTSPPPPWRSQALGEDDAVKRKLQRVRWGAPRRRTLAQMSPSGLSRGPTPQRSAYRE